MATLSAWTSPPSARTRLACAVALACALGAWPLHARAADAAALPAAAATPTAPPALADKAAPAAPDAPRPERPHGNLVPPELPPLQDRVLDTVTNKVPGVVGGAMGDALSYVYGKTFGWLNTVPSGDTVRYSLKDAHYGDTLFHFFQNRYFTAVTNLMVSQHFERVPNHADEAEVLRGGMLASYGMPRQAGEIFANLIERGASPPVRDRAWFYLAKIRYQRGYITEAEEALAHIENHLPPDLQEEKGLLQAYLLMARADYTGAAATLAAMPTKSMGARYARFNLGVALVKAGEADKGEAVLETVGKDRAPDNEYRSLRDQANVALGYAALATQRPQVARTVLERVRLEGFHANKALLGFGWAADDLKDTKQALVPWLELADRDMSDLAALEARIAVPYAYTKLGAYAQAFDRYQVAIASFEIEHKQLEESIAAIRAGKLVDALIVHNPGEEMGWFWSMQDVPEMPHGGHLVPLLAQHEFQEAFKNYRDLLFLGKNLAEWRDKLGVFDDMLETKKKAYADRLPIITQRAGALGLEGMKKRRDALAEEIQKGMDEADGVAFADARELELLARVDSVRKEIEKGGADEAELAKARERLRLASGALTWRLAAAQTDRIWEAKKGLQTIDAELGEAERRSAALAEAQREEPARFERFAQRIAALRPRLDVMIPRVAALTKEQQEAVQDIAVAELRRQQERLDIYATQARFAVAQLVDRAYVRQGAGHAAAQD